MIDSFGFQTELSDNSERVVRSTFTLKINGYIIPDVIQKNSTSISKFNNKTKVLLSEYIDGIEDSSYPLVISSGGDTPTPLFDADYQAVLDYGTTQGYTLPSSGQQILQNQLVVDLKNGGIWNKLDTFGVWATDGDSDFALIDWIRLSDYTAINSPTFTTNVGFQGDGTSSYIDSNYNAVTSGVNYVTNNFSFGWYMNTIDTSLTSVESAFASQLLSSINWVRYTNKRFYYGASAASQAYSGLTIASNQMVSANASLTNLTLFANGSLTDTLAVADPKIPSSTNFLAFRLIYASGFSDSVLGMVYAGGNLEAEASDFYNAWNTYRTSI
jgi:hypothetical protein